MLPLRWCCPSSRLYQGYLFSQRDFSEVSLASFAGVYRLCRNFGKIAASPSGRTPKYILVVVNFSLTVGKIVPTIVRVKVYVKNGSKLGWLLDRKNRKVEISRQGREVEILDEPATLSGEEVLPGFVLDLTDIF